ncbi:MAG: hypothetical protein ABSG84_01755 [Acidobacteriaceae bacterium]|jgi:hypothetical protein
MTNRDFDKLAETLMSEFPIFARHKKLLYLPLENGLLRGILFDSSDFSKTKFYVYAFLMPLFVPSKNLTLSFGDRLRVDKKFDCWDLNNADTAAKLRNAIETQGLPFLNSLGTVTDFISYLRDKGPMTHSLEALAYSLAWEGLALEAASVFDQIPPRLEPNIPWQKELRDRAIECATQLLSTPVLAIDHLKDVESTTRNNLGLPQRKAHTCSTPS